jgi:hypothetical protein
MRGAEFFTSLAFIAARWWHIIVLVLGGLMSAWIARLTDAMAPFAPYSWLAAGLLSALIMAGTLLAGSKAAEIIARWNFARKLAAGSPYLNPLETKFDRQRIKFADFYNPYNAVHTKKTFLDCELVGPSVILFTGAAVLHGIGFANCDCIAIKDNAIVHNLIVFEDVVIRGGRIYGATLLFPKSMVDRLNREMPGITWVTN